MRPDTGSDVVDAILHAAHRVRTAADANLREGGLSLSGYKLLRALAASDRSMREISEVLHVSPRTVTDIIDGLEARELVSRRPHPSDRRVTMLHLTEDGARRLAEARRGAEQARDAAISGLDRDEQRALRLLLDRVGSPPPSGEPCHEAPGAGRAVKASAPMRR
ncbi:MAG TPA: MarR family transcriptional regulator [Acidimicrobiales bacterium]|nr:MarR family transcriptional regulator [Acidimicrobiales bacterium]